MPKSVPWSNGGRLDLFSDSSAVLSVAAHRGDQRDTTKSKDEHAYATFKGNFEKHSVPSTTDCLLVVEGGVARLERLDLNVKNMAHASTTDDASKAKARKAKAQAQAHVDGEAPPKRRRGRPPGSKNKPKPAPAPVLAHPVPMPSTAQPAPLGTRGHADPQSGLQVVQAVPIPAPGAPLVPDGPRQGVNVQVLAPRQDGCAVQQRGADGNRPRAPAAAASEPSDIFLSPTPPAGRSPGAQQSVLPPPSQREEHDSETDDDGSLF